ncbi:MAG TPA: amidohydrolase family protein, partial [Steroidobacteraceae bacterium]|nr:amidohydrolase family protein [Steroidobacteraceae bacterium]
DAHTAWANHNMLQVLGVTAAAVAAMPKQNREYFRVDAKGEPTGFATEAGASQLFKALPGRDGTYDPDWGRRAVQYYNERGVTAVLEANAGHPPDDGETVLRVYKELSEQGRLTLHVSALLQAETFGDLGKIYELRRKYSGLRNFAIVGVKMFADGILEYPAQTAAVNHPYSNSGKRGVLKIAPEVMDAIAVDADRHGMIVHVHAIGDRAVHEALDAIAAARRANPGSHLPHTIAHLQLIDPADIPRFGQLQAVASFQLLWAAADAGEVKLVKPYIDPAGYALQYPARSVSASGGTVAGGSDWPVTSGNPWEAIAQAMTREGPYGVLNGSERLTLPVLLRAYTINAAKALCLESRIGSIEVGKEADLVLLPRDITQLQPREIAAVRPVWTRVHGALVTPAARDSKS